MKMTSTQKEEKTPLKILITNYLLTFSFYERTHKMNWNYWKKQKKSGEYLLQKATTNFGGRKWTVAFSKEINLSECNRINLEDFQV